MLLTCNVMSRMRGQQKRTLQKYLGYGQLAQEQQLPLRSGSRMLPLSTYLGLLAAGLLQTEVHGCMLGASTAVDTSAGGHATKLKKFLQKSIVCSHAWHHAKLAGGIQKRLVCHGVRTPAGSAPLQHAHGRHWRLSQAAMRGGPGILPPGRCTSAPGHYGMGTARTSLWFCEIQCGWITCLQHLQASAGSSKGLTCPGAGSAATCALAWLLGRWRGPRQRGLRFTRVAARALLPSGLLSRSCRLACLIRLLRLLLLIRACRAGAAAGDVAAERREILQKAWRLWAQRAGIAAAVA